VALEQTFSLFSGNDAKLSVTLTDADTGEALNLTGTLELVWALAKNAQATALLTKTLGAGVVITDASAGIVEVTLDAADTEPLKGTFYQEMRLTNSVGKKSTLLYGEVEILGNLIRS